jgi:hypothetical protein
MFADIVAPPPLTHSGPNGAPLQAGLFVRADSTRIVVPPVATGKASLSLVRNSTINRQRIHENHDVLCRGSTTRLG